MKTAENRNPNLDLMRALAIALVLVCHLGQNDLLGASLSPKFVPFGLLGVDLFFALSGYLVGGAYFKAAAVTDFKPIAFWKIRWARTLPPYYAALFLFSVFDVKKWLLVPWMKVGQLFFLQNYYDIPPGFVVSWSLCIEEHFYLLLPLFGGGLRSILARLPRTAFFTFVLVALPTVLRYYQPKLGFSVGNYGDFKQTHLRYEGLLFGVALAYFKIRLDPVLIVRARKALVPVGFFALFTSISTQSWIAPLVSAIGAALLVAAAIPSVPMRGSRNPVTEWFAIRSYSIYLIHMAIFHFGFGEGPVRTLVTIGMILGASEAFYRLVEVPALKYKDRLKSREWAEIATK